MKTGLRQLVPRLPRNGLHVTLAAALLLGLTACGPVAIPDETTAGYPPDFALVFTVRGTPDADAGHDPEPRHRSAQHVVTPDRLLRVALGRGVHADLYPAPTATLRPGQIGLLYRLSAAARDAARAQDTPAATGPPPPTTAVNPNATVNYHIILTAHGQHWTHDTTPRDNAAATALLDELIRLRGGR